MDDLVVVSQRELSVDDVRNQVKKIQDLMKSVMKEGEHYGSSYPGDKKKNLLKPGADKLCFTFRLRPEFEQKITDLGNGHREYYTKCRLYHIESGKVIAEGVGTCSTMESKYRWRKNYAEENVGLVPKEYWDVDRDNQKGREEILIKKYGPGKYRIKKVNGSWEVHKIIGDGDRVENPDIADTYNTVCKISKKRAYVDTTITACAASDLFNQDAEDFSDDIPVYEIIETPEEEPKKSDIPQKAPEQPRDVQAEVDINELKNILEQAIADGRIKENLYKIWMAKLADPSVNKKAVADAIRMNWGEKNKSQEPEMEIF